MSWPWWAAAAFKSAPAEAPTRESQGLVRRTPRPYSQPSVRSNVVPPRGGRECTCATPREVALTWSPAATEGDRWAFFGRPPQPPLSTGEADRFSGGRFAGLLPHRQR